MVRLRSTECRDDGFAAFFIGKIHKVGNVVMGAWRVIAATLLFVFSGVVSATPTYDCSVTIAGYYPSSIAGGQACSSSASYCSGQQGPGFVYATSCPPIAAGTWASEGEFSQINKPDGGAIYVLGEFITGPAPSGFYKSLGAPKPGQCAGNPCDASSGNKYQLEIDYRSAGMALSLTRSYNSRLANNFSLGFGWMTPFNKRLEIFSSTVQIRQADGRGEQFTCANNICTGDVDTKLFLTKDGSGYTLTYHDNSTDRYDTTGKLFAETSSTGQITTYVYDTNGKLSTVTDIFGHTLMFGYDANSHVSTVTDPAGNTIGYAYDNKRNLTQVNYPDGTAKIYYYEDANNPHGLTGIAFVDAANNTTRYSTYAYYYNSGNVADPNNGKATLTQHAQTDNGSAQEKFTLAYDAPAANQTAVTDPVNMQNVMTFAENLGVKNLTAKVNQSDGKALQQTFDANNNLTCRKDEENRVTLYSYNSTNQKLSMTEGLSGTDCNTCLANPANCNVGGAGRVTTYEYVSPTLDLPRFIRRPSVASGQTYETEIQYGDATHPNLTTNIIQRGFTPAGVAVSRTVTLGYNTYGQVNRVDGPRTDVTDVTTLDYYVCTTGGACGQLSRVTNALGHITTYDLYDANGRLQQMTDPNGLVTSYTYDARGRVKTVTQTPVSGSAALTQYSYTPWGDVAQVIDPDGVILNYQYDAAHYLRFIVDAAGNYIHYSYDLKGNRTGDYTYDPSGTLTRSVGYAYDLRNHLSSINLAGNTTQLIYDAVGNLRQETDPNTHTTTHTPDALNRLIRTVDALSGVTDYGYDVNNRPQAVTAPNTLSTRYSYDDLGNLLQEVSPDRNTTTYTHDAAGNVLTVTDARQITTTYTYDSLNRVTSKQSSDTATPHYTYSYDGCGRGRLCSIQRNGQFHFYFGYDGLGRRTYQLAAGPAWLYSMYVYTPAGRLQNITHPTGRTVDYQYDALGRVSQVSTTANGTTTVLAKNLQYYPFGPMQNFTFGNNRSFWTSFDQAYRPVYQFSGPRYKYATYDPAGNLSALNDINNTSQTFAYDALNQLTGAADTRSGSYGNLSYLYNANGNRQSETRNGVSTPYFYYENTNRLYHAGDSDWRLLDAAGNTTWSSDLWVVNYDGYGRQLSTSKAQAKYGYNAFDQRLQKTAGGVTTTFHYGPQGELLYETDGTDSKAYVYLNDVSLARIDDDTNIYYYHTDQLGAPQVITDSVGNVVWKALYEPFGKATVTVSTIANNLRLPGMYADSETGLYYWYSRYSDPKTGRGTQPDGMSVAEHVARWKANLGLPNQPPLEINPYVYVANNPLRWIDPDGHMGQGWGGSKAPGVNPPPFPNGNYEPGFAPQDSVCTVPIVGGMMNSNSCVLNCCKAHDDCYTRNGCNSSSWKGNYYGFSMACQQCNAEAKRCVSTAITNGCSSCGSK